MKNKILIEELDHHATEVTFMTKRGTKRTMVCTRNLGLVPEADHQGIYNPILNGEGIVCVYDFQNSGWRAFRFDSVLSVRRAPNKIINPDMVRV